MSRTPLLATLLFALCIASAGRASAQNARHYGARGRTVINAGVGALGTNLGTLGDPFHSHKWSSGWLLSLAHFVRDNIAVGGTVKGEAAGHVADEPVSVRTGGDLDVLFHLPFATRVSMQFWLWTGVRYRSDYETVTSDLEPTYYKSAVSLVAGLQPDLLIHLSSSVALALGVGVELHYVKRDGVSGSIPARAGLLYSFGPDPEALAGRSRLDDAARFSSPGRNVLFGGLWLGSGGVVGSAGYARFVRARVALGGYVSSAWLRDLDEPDSIGGGALAIIDLPIARTFSVLSPLGLGYMWREAHSDFGETLKAHELQLRVPAYLALHLHEALLIGVGPLLIADFRLANSQSPVVGPAAAGPEELAPVYVAGGLGSTLMASF